MSLTIFIPIKVNKLITLNCYQRWSKKHSVDKSQAVPGATGSTALHVACANGCVKIVDLLLRNNARVTIRDKYGSTPIDIALAKNEKEIIELLRNAEKIQRKTGNNKAQHQKSNSVNKRKSLDFHMTHKRSGSEKHHPRIRRPSLPSIFEKHSTHNRTIRNRGIHLTPTTPLTSANNSSTPTFHHNHHVDEHTHSCPSTPRCSLDYKRQSAYSPRSSEDSSRLSLSTSPSNTLYIPVEPSDWYGYGVVRKYDDDNYLISLERRAYNLGSNNITNSMDTSVERRSIESKRSIDSRTSYDDSSSRYRSDSVGSSTIDLSLQMTMDKNSTATTSSLSLSPNETPSDEDDDVDDEEGYDGEEDDDDDEPVERPTLTLDDELEANMIRLAFRNDDISANDNQTVNSLHKPEKKKWLRDIGKDIKRTSLDSIHRRSLDFRPSFDSFTNLAKKSVEGISHLSMDESSDVTTDDDSQRTNQHNSGFFSKWVPAWSRKQ